MAARRGFPQSAHYVFPFGAVCANARTIERKSQKVRDFMRHGAIDERILILAQKHVVKANMVCGVVCGASRFSAQVKSDCWCGEIAPEHLASKCERCGNFG